MGKRLRKSVVSGGVVYPAGATVPDDVAANITADVWASKPETAESPDPGSESAPRPAKKAPGRKKPTTS